MAFKVSGALADSPAPQYDYVIDVGDGELVFVMLSIPHDTSAYGQGGAVRDEEIRATYSQSGLYKANDNLAPIWTVDWYAFRVFITEDGKYLVRMGPWPSTLNYDEMALQFYEEGELLKTYSVSDLVFVPYLLPNSVSHYTWEETITFHDEALQLALKTKTGETYFFDVATGELILGWPVGQIRGLLLRMVCLGLPGLLIAGFILRRRKKFKEGNA